MCWVSIIKSRLVVIRPSLDDCWCWIVIKQILLEKNIHFRTIQGKTYFLHLSFGGKYSFFLKIQEKIFLKMCMNHLIELCLYERRSYVLSIDNIFSLEILYICRHWILYMSICQCTFFIQLGCISYSKKLWTGH